MCTETAKSLAAAIARGDLTSTAVVETFLARAAAADPYLHAFIAIYGEHARVSARALDAERTRGVIRGPLHGVPVVLKDLIDVAGQPTTAGSRLYARAFAAADAALTRRLLAAGMVILGKTQMVEMAYGGWGTHAVMGTPRNPWDLATHRVPGGSSSGAAVAVAAGLAPLAIGTDTGGSVRIPAALCGLVGLRTTAGQVPYDGVMQLSPTLDTLGPLAKTVSDLALLYEVMTGRHPQLTTALPRALRIGILGAADLGNIDGDVRAAFEGAQRSLLGMGAALTEISFGSLPEDFVEPMSVIIGYEGWRIHGLRILGNPAAMDPHVRARFLAGQRVTATRYQAVMRERAAAQVAALATLRDVDAVLTPTTPFPAPALADVEEDALPLSRFTRWVGYLGLCALSVPAGLSSGGLPVAIQLVGRPGTEATLLAIARAFEQARGPSPQPDLSALGLP
jgi:aspartyl-tRNA(Asn)/glutamyl-tRNA(Gln) amidotransferase subunit A